MNYQWYPGHMTKAKRMMEENIKLIDLIIEVVDARIPVSSRNPDIDELGKNKARLLLLNKSDLADPEQNEAWSRFFQEKGFHVLKLNSRSGSGVKGVLPLVMEACKEKIERDRRRGIKNVLSGLWWWESPMWENPLLSTHLQEKPAPRPETSPG